jgi:malate synthase
MTMATAVTPTLSIVGSSTRYSDRILTPEALEFVARLHGEFADRRDGLLARRKTRLAELMGGHPLRFPADTASIRSSEWRVAPAPRDLDDRRV